MNQSITPPRRSFASKLPHHLISIAIALALAGCGQMGPLYQPVPEDPPANSPGTPNSPSRQD
ncbi:MAG: lipoprotein [Congregibacter sp.]